MRLHKYQHIIWDWNGTLLNDAWLCVEVMNQMLKERQLRLITIDIYKEIFNFPVKEYYKQLGFDFNREPFEQVGMEFMVLYNERQLECKLHDDVVVTLETIQKLGYSQSILSAREQNELRIETKDLKVDHFFQLIYGLDDHYAHGKTDVGVKLIEDLGIDKSKLLFLGDTLHDSEVALELGIDCLLIPNGHHSVHRLEKTNHQLVHSFNEILTMLS